MFQKKITDFVSSKNKCYICKKYDKNIVVICDFCKKKKEDQFINKYKSISDEDLRKIYMEDFY
jgi:hypothetical protein